MGKRGLGCGCEFIVQGKEIVPKAADFYQSNLAEWFEDDEEDETAEKEQIIKEAVENPTNFDTVIRLLDMVSEAIEFKSDAVL